MRASTATATERSSTSSFVGTGYFDEVTQVIASGKSSVTALKHSTEEEQFGEIKVPAEVIPVGEDPACRPILGECPLGCGHAHIEHPHLDGMHD